jgi:probable phosphoglycerate mutase
MPHPSSPPQHAGEPTRIIAIRHGETAWNVDTRLQGQLDVPLNQRGQAQAQRAALAVAQEAPQRIYSSDLQRARDTAAALAQATGLPLLLDAGLRERHFGLWQGHTYAEVEQGWPTQSERWRRREPAFGPEGGETLQAFFDRVVATASRLAAQHPGQTVVMVAHGGVLDCLYRAATHIALDAPRTWELPNTGVNRLLWTGESFTLIGWADVSHLDDAARDESADRVGSAA